MRRRQATSYLPKVCGRIWLACGPRIHLWKSAFANSIPVGMASTRPQGPTRRIISREMATSFTAEPTMPAAGFAAGFASAASAAAYSGHGPSANFATTARPTTTFERGLPPEIPVDVVDHAIDHVGQAHSGTRRLRRWPAFVAYLKSIVSLAREPYAARAVVLSMLLNQDASIRASQMQSLGRLVAPDVAALVKKISPTIDQLDAHVRLPLVDVASTRAGGHVTAAVPAIYRSLSVAGRCRWTARFVRVGLVANRHSPPQAALRRLRGQQRLADCHCRGCSAPCAVVLSAVAYAGNSDERAQKAFAAAASQLSALRAQARVARGGQFKPIATRAKCDCPSQPTGASATWSTPAPAPFRPMATPPLKKWNCCAAYPTCSAAPCRLCSSIKNNINLCTGAY